MIGRTGAAIRKEASVLGEFDYDGNPAETFHSTRGKSAGTYLLKRYLLPPLYWYGMLKGIA
ncbi:MAG: hypothetical protein ACXW2L_20545 [Burkholderiales bacterium]